MSDTKSAGFDRGPDPEDAVGNYGVRVGLIQINAPAGARHYAIHMNSGPYPAPNDPATAHEWRRRAQRARFMASSLAGDPAEQRLLQLASEYEERAAQAEASVSSGK